MAVYRTLPSVPTRRFAYAIVTASRSSVRHPSVKYRTTTGSGGHQRSERKGALTCSFTAGGDQFNGLGTACEFRSHRRGPGFDSPQLHRELAAVHHWARWAASKDHG